MTAASRPSDQVALADLFTRLGRELTAQRSTDEVLNTISHRAYEVIPAAEHAAISRGRNGRFETVAATSGLPPRVDQIQYDLMSGPCVDAILADTSYRISELAVTNIWPEFGKRAAHEYNIHSMLSVRIYLETDDLLAGLNLYSSAPDAFDDSDQVTATLLATHGALALSAADRQDKIGNLERALQTSRRIGMAVGILMVTYKTTDSQAFDLLRIGSQNRNRKLADIAEGVIETGAIELPATPRSRTRE
jgi:transcriptional regulator with GAF, ATPase, and Fis domain